MSFLAAQAIMLWTLLGPMRNLPWWEGFRGYFANDQLSYAAIALTAAKGNLAPVEPLTETGVSHYPSLWYLLLGITSFLTGQPVHLLWTILGLSIVSFAVAFLGVVAYRLSTLAFAPLLPGAAILTGSLSAVTSDWWYTSLGSHAVYWGPFGTLFTLNAEVVGVITNVLIFALVLLAMTEMRPHTARIAIVVSGISLGVLANVHTYSFLSGVSLAVCLAAVFSLLRYPSIQRLIVTIGLVAIVLLFGSWLAGFAGPLPIFLLLLLAGLPAIAPLIRTHRRVTLASLALFTLAAAPQIVRTGLGIASGDEFLTYRQESTVDLGVPFGPALLGALPMLLIAGFTVLTLIAVRNTSDRRTHRAMTALLLALGIGSTLMSGNDLWGFDQEPYRFWLQYSLIAIMLLSVTTAWALRQWLSESRLWQTASGVVAAMALIVWTLSLTDVRLFRSFAAEQGILSAQDSTADALRSAVPPDQGLVLSSRCLDPQLLKLITQAPVASFNRGLAWPDNRVLIDDLREGARSRVIAHDDLTAAGIRLIITDTRCTSDWEFSDARIVPVQIARSDDRTFTVWQVRYPDFLASSRESES